MWFCEMVRRAAASERSRSECSRSECSCSAMLSSTRGRPLSDLKSTIGLITLCVTVARGAHKSRSRTSLARKTRPTEEELIGYCCSKALPPLAIGLFSSGLSAELRLDELRPMTIKSEKIGEMLQSLLS
eukprot:GHVU01017006.1.p2 GENE.GHVU01017006.1~~GHVU01017006.1.p2  ORF type:complete len:129 (+),score=4.93 GHVU01017006.1:256-642(+)